ncbi:SRPBCC family protein [Ekhidna sp.]|uniref:SRPBCC family protein n=1 Tax=Ekhidna sp. TaxID=2608089 RepID=UPI0032EE3DCB
MKYKEEIIIRQSRGRVIELFDNPENMKEWQPDLVSFKQMSGMAGYEGAKSKLIYKIGKREVEMIETVTKRDLPDEFAGSYETKGVLNTVRNNFEAMGADSTKWIVETEFKFSGLMNVFAWLMPGTFKKQTRDFMRSFKEFAEMS